jgi:hypothetical protein
MSPATSPRQIATALLLAAALSPALAQGGIAAPPNKQAGATSQPATGAVPTVAGPSTISVAPKKTHKAIAKAKAASAAASH